MEVLEIYSQQSLTTEKNICSVAHNLSLHVPPGTSVMVAWAHIEDIN